MVHRQPIHRPRRRRAKVLAPCEVAKDIGQGRQARTKLRLVGGWNTKAQKPNAFVNRTKKRNDTGATEGSHMAPLKAAGATEGSQGDSRTTTTRCSEGQRANRRREPVGLAGAGGQAAPDSARRPGGSCSEDEDGNPSGDGRGSAIRWFPGSPSIAPGDATARCSPNARSQRDTGQGRQARAKKKAGGRREHQRTEA